jgi:hypothetical protein
MSENEKPLDGTLDWYREKAKSDPHIAILVKMIDRQNALLVSSLDVIVALGSEIRQLRQGGDK